LSWLKDVEGKIEKQDIRKQFNAMEKLFNFLTATNGIIAFYFILASLRQLTLGVNGNISTPLLAGVFFLSVVFVLQMLRRIVALFVDESAVSKNQSGSEFKGV
jgi:hypothetical protein